MGSWPPDCRCPLAASGKRPVPETGRGSGPVRLAGKTPGFAQWSSLRLPREMLLSWFAEAEDSDFKRHLAFALALRNEPAVLPLLRRMFAQRDPFQPETSRKYNHARGYVALYFLGRLADAESVEPIGQVLLDQQSDHRYEYASHAIGALLRIGQAHPGGAPESGRFCENSRKIRTRS
ncbi:MAG: HEAT repeat domain-containing protein [Lentisphaeria bacterium]|nr:MAG: HEAT repeat domain-containing protein [Lentisphaeria bacterium]